MRRDRLEWKVLEKVEKVSFYSLTINIELKASRVLRNRIIDPAEEDFSSIFRSDLSQKNGSHMNRMSRLGVGPSPRNITSQYFIRRPTEPSGDTRKTISGIQAVAKLEEVDPNLNLIND